MRRQPYADFMRLMRLDKPIGILLLLWPTLWAVWIAANGQPSIAIVFIFVMGTILTRSGGCVINDLLDRQFDGYVQRTKDRPLVTGRVSVTEAITLAGICFFLAFLLIVGLSRLTIILAFVAIFLAASYPLMKRIIRIPQAYLGLAFSFGIPMAYAAIQNALPLTAWILFFAGCFWSIAYDTEYAMVDREDDLNIGINTSAITFGQWDTLAIVICYGLMQACLIWVGFRIQAGLFYYLGLWFASLMMVYHYILIRKREPDACFKAFLHNAWVGGVIFAGIVADYWIPIGTTL